MRDIVERLRNDHPFARPGMLQADAADEIDRLRAKVAHAEDGVEIEIGMTVWARGGMSNVVQGGAVMSIIYGDAIMPVGIQIEGLAMRPPSDVFSTREAAAAAGGEDE